MVTRILQVSAIVLVLFCIGLAVYVEIDTRNFISRLPQPPAVEQQRQDASPAEVSHTHDKTVQTQVTATKKRPETYDRRTDDEHAHSHTDVDPGAQLSSPDDGTAGNELENQYPPPNWRKTLDPELYAEYYRAQLIKQFSDVPQIDVLADALATRKFKVRAKIPMTIDEAIASAEAMYTLWPDEDTLGSIEYLHEIRASGRPYNPTYGPPVEPPADPFRHLVPIVTPFIEEFGEVEGIRLLKILDPQTAMEVKRALIHDAHTVGATTPGYYEAKMKMIEEVFGDTDK